MKKFEYKNISISPADDKVLEKTLNLWGAKGYRMIDIEVSESGCGFLLEKEYIENDGNTV